MSATYVTTQSIGPKVAHTKTSPLNIHQVHTYVKLSQNRTVAPAMSNTGHEHLLIALIDRAEWALYIPSILHPTPLAKQCTG